MRYRHNQADVSHALTAYFLLGYFHAAAIADDALVTDAFVFTTMAFVILYRTKNTFAEQTITLGLISPVVDRFRLDYLTARALQNGFRRSQANGNRGEVAFYFIIFLIRHTFVSK